MSSEGKTYEFEVDGRLHRTHDAIMDGRQVRSAADRTPPSSFILIEARNHATRSIGLEERVHLDPERKMVFRTFPGDRSYTFTVDERGWEWGAATIAEADVRLYGNVGDDLDLVLDGQTDVAIERGGTIDLEGSGVEQIRTRPSKKPVTIIVNGREKEVPRGPIGFEALIALAFEAPPTGPSVSFTVTFRKGPDNHPEGSLVAGQSVQAKQGMIFNVRATDKS